jgi:hypothetical protein
MDNTQVVDNVFFAPPPRVSEGSHISKFADYKKLYDQSIQDPDLFWGNAARGNFYFCSNFEIG